MNVFMIVGGALLFVVAFFALMGLVLGLATSVIQIIVVVLCSGFGLLAFGLSGIMSRLDDAARTPTVR
jgi:hypothetical protein